MTSVLKKIPRILPYIFVFIASIYLPTDPDLGWHLKYGEYFFQHHQLLRDNTFSTMMANYHWANGSWGTDIITYVIYKVGGFGGLTLVSAGVVTATFFFIARAGGLGFISETIAFPVAIFLLYPLNSVSFRGEQLSYLFLGMLLFLLSKYKPFTKLFYLIPLLFLLWFNIHEESFLMLALFVGWVGMKILQEGICKDHPKKLLSGESIFLLSIAGASMLTACINPFGISLVANATSYINNPLLKDVSQYQPFHLFSLYWIIQIVITLIVLIATFVLTPKKRHAKDFPLLVIVLGLLLLGFEMRRYLWPAYYILLLFCNLPAYFFKSSRSKYAYLTGFIISLISIIFVFQSKLPLTQYQSMSWDTYCTLQEVPCSPASAEFLQRYKLTNSIFSYYDWGGWMIWNYPDIKPSIDGRMHIWRDASGYSATDDYDKYITATKSIDASPYDMVYLPNDQSPLALELSALIQQKKWKAVYTDARAGIVERVKKRN
ncbi:MAG TPA: hypothetical protein VLF93_03600 [Candidatus Saccharimonadales bacterium]|nr:hypothetical protein [Candidatus Saccharimonadales bacterium]